MFTKHEHEFDKEGKSIDELTDDMMAYVCDRLCKYPEALNETEFDDMCANCHMHAYVCNIINRHTTEKELDNMKCYRALADKRRYEKSLLEMKRIIEGVIKGGKRWEPGPH